MNFNKFLTLKDIKELYSDEYSCIKKISSSFTLLLHPMNAKNIKMGIKNELNSMSKIYIQELGGILMGYEDLKILSPKGWLFETNPNVHINIKADFYVFSPQMDDVLKGTVVKKSRNVVGCLVHNIFNASSTIPQKVVGDQWCGSRVSEGDSLQMKITKLDLMSFVPYIRGEIIPESISKISSESHSQLPDSKGSQQQHILFNEEDSGISSVDKSFDEETPVKKKKKKKARQDDDVVDSTCTEDQQQIKEELSPLKKKKKKYDETMETFVTKKECFSEEQTAVAIPINDVVDSTCTEDQQQIKVKEELSPLKKKKKKKKKYDETMETFVTKKDCFSEEQTAVAVPIKEGSPKKNKLKGKIFVNELQVNVKEELSSDIEPSLMIKKKKKKKRERDEDDTVSLERVEKKIKRDPSDEEVRIKKHKRKV